MCDRDPVRPDRGREFGGEGVMSNLDQLPELAQVVIGVAAILFFVAPIFIWRNTEKIGAQNDAIIRLLSDIKHARRD